MEEEEVNKGFIKLNRKLLEWEWFEDSRVLQVWVYLLIKANHKKVKKRGFVYEKGTLFINHETIENDCKVSRRTLYRVLDKLRKSGCIETKRTQSGLIIKVINYSNYQDVRYAKNDTSRGTSDGTSRGTLNKNEKNEKNTLDFLESELALNEIVRGMVDKDDI